MIVTNIVVLAGLLVLVVLERLGPLRRLSLPVFRPSFAGDLGWLAIGLLLSSAAMTYFRWGSSLLGSWGIPRLAAVSVPLWVTSLLALLLLDVGNYASHLLMHRFGTLWEFHKTHHSIRTLDWLAAFRFHAVEIVIRRLVTPLLLVAAGMPLKAVALAAAALQLWGMLTHSNLGINLRFLEPLLITPRLHQLHHVPASSETNLGTVLSIWDRLLGRLETRSVPPDVELGVPNESRTYPQGFFKQLAEPFRRMKTFPGREGQEGSAT
jgi:sterol desaturase/sphingolipid hydroxylase (fatty acid hydroxylase superfamily)